MGSQASLRYVSLEAFWFAFHDLKHAETIVAPVIKPPTRNISPVPGQYIFYLTRMISEHHTELPQLKPLVTLTGTAKGAVGPPVGLVDIGVNESGYIFRVALPGIGGNKSSLRCNIQLDGRVRIEGVTAESQFIQTSSKMFEMKLQQLCPAGPFTVSFNLPGPVDPRLCNLTFRSDGILEVIVLKFRIPRLSADGLFQRWYDCWLPS